MSSQVTHRVASVPPERLGFGAVPTGDGVRFQVWAPNARDVDVELVGERPPRFLSLPHSGDGIYCGICVGLGPGTRYRFRLDGGASYPDPCSRSQPDGVHGPSEVVDPNAFTWTDLEWGGPDPERLVIYEVHVGAFSQDGTFDAVAEETPELRNLGITAIELMPIAEFSGRWNWGYDGVDLFAPSRNYGGVVGLKRLVNVAHREGLAVILDVVYNHLGPDGNYLRTYSKDYFTQQHRTPWGDAINYDGPNSRHVREFVFQNACYWLKEYHLDGLRLDATHAIFDDGAAPLVAELAATARETVGSKRRIVMIAEDDRNDVRLIRPRSAGGMGLDALWADDFHHAVHVMLTGEHEGYYADYSGSAPDLARTISQGLFYQGQYSPNPQEPRGAPVTGESPSGFVFCIQNHDQVGNRAFGERLNHLVDLDRYAVASALLILCPETPLLFMGQEFAASSPFLYFTDHEPTLGQLVTEGRRREFGRFSAFRDPRVRQRIPDPQTEDTFRRSKLDFRERDRHRRIYDLYRQLLRMRRVDPVLSHPERRSTATQAIGDRCVVVRRWHADRQRWIVANFGEQLRVTAPAELFGDTPPTDVRLIFQTGDAKCGLATVGAKMNHGKRIGELVIPARTALVFAAGGVEGDR